MIKWLVRLGSAVGLLLIVFVGVMVMLGGGRNVANTEAQIEIDRPAESIFPFLTDGPSLIKWIQGMESFQTNDELKVGRRAQVVMVLGGRRHELISETLAMVPPRSLTVRLDHAEFVDDIDYNLVEHDGPSGKRTTLHQRSSAHYNSLVIRLLTPLFARDVEHAMKANLATLKGLVEREPMMNTPRPMPGQTGFHGCCAAELPSH